MRPRIAVVVVGVSFDHMPVSETTTTSQASRSLCRRSRSAKCGEPDSSSPSTISFRFTAGAVRPVTARCARTPRAWKNTWPLSSAAPRPTSRSPRSTGSKGSLSHSSTGSTGCTSWWPYTTTVGAFGSPDGHSAKTAGSPAVSHTSTVGNPVSLSLAASHSADRRTSGCRSGWPEMDGIRSHSLRSAKNWEECSAMYARTTLSGVVVILKSGVETPGFNRGEETPSLLSHNG